MKIKEVTLNDLNEVISSEKKLFKEELRINQKDLEKYINVKDNAYNIVSEMSK